VTEDATPRAPSPWQDLYKTIWSDKIKPFFDFRAYVNQRREIIRHPDLEFSPELTSAAEWKGPLAFAIQGVVVTLLIVKALTWSFATAFHPPEAMELYIEFEGSTRKIIPQSIPVGESIWSFRSNIARKDIATLKEELYNIQNSTAEDFPGPTPYSERPVPLAFILSAATIPSNLSRNVAELQFRQEVAKVERQLTTYVFMENYTKVSSAVGDYAIPITFFLSSYFFLVLCRVDRGPYDMRGREQDLYLYYVIARLFTVNLIYVLLVQLYANLQIYYPPSFKDLVADLSNTLAAIDSKDDKLYFLHGRDFYFQSAFIICGCWAYMVIRSIGRILAPVLQLEPAARFWKMYSGEKKVRKDIVVAGIFSSLIVFSSILLAAYLYEVSSTLLDQFRI
jgi:hypothetical protein